MSRINTNVGALIAQHRLGQSQNDLQSTLSRLSSGLRITRGADDPAGLIVSEKLRSEIAGIGQSISNAQRASQVIATTEGALNEVAALLVNVRELIVEAANDGAMSQEEIEANQLQVDSAVDSITRIANTASFAGMNLLDGSLDYQTSGVDTSEIESLAIYGANFGTQSTIPVSIQVTTSAQVASLQFQNSHVGGSSIGIEVKGPEGVATLNFQASANVSAMMFAINMMSDVTGVSASYINAANEASGIAVSSRDYGSKAFVSIEVLPPQGGGTPSFPGYLTKSTDYGQDAVASINGALTVGDGRELSLNTLGLDMDLTLRESFGTGNTSFKVTGGGALFQLGPEVKTNQQTNIGVQSVAASRLGNATVGFLSQIVTGGQYSLRDKKFQDASAIIDAAIEQIAVQRGRLGAFEKNTLMTNVNSMQIALENVTASESQIRDADFAVETSNLTRSQILQQAGTSVLAIANSTPQTVLSLLQ